MGIYLLDNPPARDQYRSPRRKRPTGLTVIHTAESVMDSLGPDTGAEDVAAFIRRRSDAGSYHDLVDSDSVIQLVRYEDEAYQDGTGSNPFALSISFALKTTDWVKLSPEKRAAFLRQGAVAFARQQAWLRANGYPTTPLRRITKAQSDAGEAGFISHAERDPARRTDPGRDFPWGEFFAACRAALAGTNPANPGGFLVALNDQQQAELYNAVVNGRKADDEWNARVEKLIRDTYNAAVQTRDIAGDARAALQLVRGDLAAALQDEGASVTDAQLEAALRKVFGSLDNQEA